MQVNAPEADVQQASVASIAVGQVAIGPVTVGELVLQDVDFQLDSGLAVIRNMTVTMRLRIDFEWRIQIPLPIIDDIDIGDTNHLGTFAFGLPSVGDVTIPGLSNLNVNIPSLTARGISASANPLANLQLSNAAAEQIEARDVVLPSAGFTIAGLTLNSVEGDNIGVPAASIREATVRQVRGAPLAIGEFSLNSVTVGSATVPSLRSTSPFDVPVNLQSRRLGPDDGFFGFGVLRFALIITPSATAHIPHLEINNSNARATTGRVVLRNVTLPFDVLNLTLSQIGINSIGIPAFTTS